MSLRPHACGAAVATAMVLIVGGAAPPTAHAQGPATARLEGNPQTTQFGWFDNSQAPVARIRSNRFTV